MTAGNGGEPTTRDLIDVAQERVRDAGRELAAVGPRASYFPAVVGVALAEAVNALGAAIATLDIRVSVIENRLDAAEEMDAAALEARLTTLEGQQADLEHRREVEG